MRVQPMCSGGDPPPLIGNFNGHWRLVGLYVDAYADMYGYDALSGAYTMPPDPAVIDNLAELTGFCAVDGTNNCTNDFYHDRADCYIAAAFAQGGASTYVGFSEQSFYILLNEADRSAPLYATEIAYGPQEVPLLYVDAFTVNAATCPSGSACDGDAVTVETSWGLFWVPTTNLVCLAWCARPHGG